MKLTDECCKNCAFWDPTKRLLSYPLLAGVCRRADYYARHYSWIPDDKGALAWYDHYNEPATLYTSPTFGCNEFQERDRLLVKVAFNGTFFQIISKDISYSDVVWLSYCANAKSFLDMCTVYKPGRVFTVTYRHGPSSNSEGSLVDGQQVKVTDGMIFNCTETGSA